VAACAAKEQDEQLLRRLRLTFLFEACVNCAGAAIERATVVRWRVLDVRGGHFRGRGDISDVELERKVKEVIS
jgi:hypothetical protein